MNKMQKICLSLSILAVFLASVSLTLTWSSGAKKIAYVNSAKLLDKVDLIGQVKETIKKQEDDAQKRIDTLDMEYRTRLFSFEKNQNKLSKMQKQTERKQLEFLQNQLLNYHASLKESISKNREEMMRTNLIKINEIITIWAKDNNYDIILATTTSGNIAYANDKMDVTDAIADKINRR